MDTNLLHHLYSYSDSCTFDSTCSQGAGADSFICSVLPFIQMEKTTRGTKALAVLSGSCAVLLATAVCCDVTFSGISWCGDHCFREKPFRFTSCCLAAAASLSAWRIFLVRLHVCDFPLNAFLSSNCIPAASAD